MRISAALRLLAIALVVSLALVTAVRPAGAQPAGTQPADAPPAAPQPAGLPAVVDTGTSGLDAAAVQAAIERELGVPLVIDATASDRLEVVVTGQRASVTYYAQNREPVTRSVDLPKDPERATETIAFLAGNLARDEASELLAQLAPPAAGAEPDSVPRPEPAPAPAPEAPKPAPVAVPPPKPTEPALIEPQRFAANVSLYYPLTGLKHTEQRRLNLELGLAYSRVGAIHGGGAALGYFRSDGLVEGFSVALGWNRSGPVKGIQLAGLVNEGKGDLRGIGVASLVSVRDGDTRGIQAAAIVTHTHLAFGLQASAVVAVAREVQGVQAGVVASVSGPVQGIQAGVVNVAGPFQGVEVGVVNSAGRTDGLQVGGVNVAGPVHGLQLGLVNVADEIHGGALGFVSIAKNGRLQPTAWFAGPNESVYAGLKSVTDYTYSQIAIGGEPGAHHVGHQETLGAHLELGGHFYTELGGGYGETYKDQAKSPLVRSEARFDGRVGFEPVYRLTLFLGGTVTRRIEGHGAPVRGEYFVGLSLL